MKYLAKANLLFIALFLMASELMSLWSQDIRELTFSNLSSQSIVVSYGQPLALGQIKVEPTVKKLHRLAVDGLVPDSQYYFTVTTNDSTVSSDARTAKVGAGVPYTLYGQLMTSTQQPLSGALVTVSATSNAETSSLLTSISNNSGFWNVNLGNLKGINTGAVFNHQSGTQLSISVHHLPDVISSHQQVRAGSSPQKIVLPDFVLDNSIPPQKLG